jgi:hypothetical protein
MNPIRLHHLWPTWLVGVALVAVFFGERVLGGSDAARAVFDIIAALCLLGAVGMRAKELKEADADKKPVARLLFLTTAGVLVALILYALIPLALSSDGAKRANAVVWALWPVIGVCSAIPLAAIELTTFSVAFNQSYEHARVRASFERGLALALLASVIFYANYLANRHELKWDVTYGQKTEASEQTRHAVRDLTSDVEITLFFPKANEVLDAIVPYFDTLKPLSPHLKIQIVDLALASDLAKKTGATENGVVAVSHDKAHEKVRLGEKFPGARSSVRKLDQSFLGALLKVVKEKKTAYFTTGHQERSATPAADDNRSPTKLLKEVLDKNQYTVKPLGIAEGLAEKVPSDASMIFIMGPEKPFSTEEIASINRAIDKGGVRMFIALEPERDGDSLKGILEPLGVSFDKTLLANERTNVPFTRTEADRTSIWSNRYSSHESVTTMTRNNKLATIFHKAGSLTKADKLPERVKVDMVLTAVDDTFQDKNGNNTFDKDSEKKSAYGLAAAITRTSTSGKKSEESRIFVVADGDVFADELIKFEGNFTLLADIAYWLRAVDDTVIPTLAETDVQIVHRKEEDTLWFYSTTFGVPAIVLAFGIFNVVRRKRA